MPTAGDPFLGPGGLPISHSPLERIGYFPNRPQTPDLDALIDAVQQWVADFLFPAIKRYTGIDLSPFLPILNNVVDNLQLLFGFLDQDTSTFDKVAAGAYLIENVLQYTGLMATIEQIGTFITGIDAATGGIISQFFADIRYIIGDPLGLGTGTVIIGSSPFDIPILAPVADLVQQLIDGLFQALGGTGPGTVSSVVSYLTSVVGDVSGLVSDVLAFVAAVGGGNMAGAGTALAGVVSEFNDLASNLTAFLTATGEATWAALGALINSLIDFLTTVPAELISGTLTGAVEVGGRAIDVLVQHLNAAGQYDAAYLLGEIGDAVTVGGTGIVSVINDVFDRIQAVLDAIFQAINGGLSTGNTVAAVKAALEAIPGANILISGANTLPGYLTNIVSTGLYDASAGFQNLATSLLKNLTPTGGNIGQFDASALTGAINTALTFNGTALSTLLQYLNSAGQFSAAQLTGALNGAVTLGGATLSTLVTNINSSGQILASGITGALGTGLTVGGVTLGTLFTNINSSGQLVLSGATGALNTAVTIGGTALSTLSTNWNAAVTNVNSLISGVSGASTAADVATNINLAATNIAQIGTAAQNAAAGVVGSLNTAATQVQTAFSGILNGLFGGLTGTPAAVNQTQAQLNTAAQGVVSNSVGNAATFVGIQNAEAAAANLMSVRFKFADYGAGTVALPSDFTLSNDTAYYPGTDGSIELVDGRAVYKKSGTGTSMKIARYNAAPTATNFQEISWVHTGNQESSPALTAIYARMNAAATSYLKFELQNGDLLNMIAVVGGEQTYGGAASNKLKPGAKYTIRCGDLSAPNNIYFYENDILVKASGEAVHQIGASYRYAGFGFSGLNTGVQWNNFGIDVFSVADQVFKPGPPAEALVSTQQTTSSATYANLATTGPAVTVTIGSSGMALVCPYAHIAGDTIGNQGYMSVEVSGATTVAAADSQAVGYQTSASSRQYAGAPLLFSNLNPGPNTFTSKYRRAGAGSVFFANRRIAVIPL